jgi:hypothetical protein
MSELLLKLIYPIAGHPLLARTKACPVTFAESVQEIFRTGKDGGAGMGPDQGMTKRSR